ncbi:MAG: radical SAM family heme chaperone HemW [Actinomycetota bacterium]
MSVATVMQERTGEWLERPGFGVYVHIPFCTTRCHYCDFNTYEGQDTLHAAYVDALVTDIERFRLPSERECPHSARFRSLDRGATSVFFGGGTPTLLDASALARILGAVKARFGLAPGAEITVESNPESVDEIKLDGLLSAGFNRLSVGVQSLAPHVLKGLGRTHSSQRALGALAAARRVGFEDLNADLIYGSPWERPDDWAASLAGVLEAQPDHVSAYALTVETGTPLHTLVATGRVPDVDPDVQAERHALADEILATAGYARYEISNWARPGCASRHNVLYWSAGDYAGFGAGAHGHVAGRRSWALRLPRDFVTAVDAGCSTEAGSEILGPDARAGEALMLGLRLASGINTRAFALRFGDDALAGRSATIDTLCSHGLLERIGSRLRLADGATLVANDVLCRLL